MYKFVSRVKEIKKIITQFRLIEITLDSIIILLLSFIILQFTGIRPGWIIFILPIIYYLVALNLKMKYDLLGIIEEKYPSLRERLSTVYDNREKENIVMEDLASRVYTDIEEVQYSSFIATRRLGIRAVLVILLVALVLLTSMFNPSQPEQKNILDTLMFPESENDKANSNPDTDIFNEPSYVKIEGEEERLIVYRGAGYELNVQGEEEQVSGVSPVFPAGPSSTEIYTDPYPAIYQQIVKNYFTNISISG